MTTASILGSWCRTMDNETRPGLNTAEGVLAFYFLEKCKRYSTCSTVQGGPRYLLWPMNWKGEALWLNIGSVRIFSPSISTRTVAWPSQVTLSPGPDSERSGVWMKYGSSTGSSLSRAYGGGLRVCYGQPTHILMTAKRMFQSYDLAWSYFSKIIPNPLLP